jgi:hypothetical protein
MLGVLFLILMIMISLSVALPQIGKEIERDREVETVHRGKQYIRAIKLYYKQFQAYPPNMEALEKTNNIRFLRKRYKDPITGKDEWRLIHFGENKTPSYGLFGQPLGGTGGSVLAGTGPGGAGSSLTGSSFGSSFNSGGSFGNSNQGGNSSFGGNSNFNSGTSSTGTSTDPNAGGNANSGTGTGSGTGTDSGSTTNGTGIASSFGNTSGQTFGGGGIIGVAGTSPKPSILEWHKKKHFNEWEFWYDPNTDRTTVSGGSGAIGTPASGVGNGGTASPSIFNSPTNSTVPPPTQPTPTPPPTDPSTTSPQ